MPIYEYACGACGHKLEKLQKVSDAPMVDCPECDEPGLRKLVSAVAFRLKGSGWYETDFKDEKSRKNLAKDEDKPKEPGTGKTNDAGDKETKKGGKEPGDGTGDKSADKATKVESNAVKSFSADNNTTA